MRKGLITLMTVAIALAGVQAMAMAPVIGNIPSPVVGGKQTSTQPQAYVYPDAIDLNSFASDDATAVTDLKWSYEVSGSSKYLINGVQPINSATTLAKDVTTAQQINKTDNETATGKDAFANTITVRNQRLFPLGGTSAAPSTSGGVIDIQPVTLWCSDGSTSSFKSVLFYTNLGSTNYLSTKGWSKVAGNDFTSWDHTWKLDGLFLGNVTTTTLGSTGGGMCFNTTTTGDNYASLVSGGSQNVPYVVLTENQVYRVRARMNSSQPTPGKTPFWDFVVENWPAGNATSLNLYASDWFFLDNELGANSVLSVTGGTWISMYWAPAPVLETGTNWASLFTPTYSATKDARIRFRVMDLTSSPIMAANQFGQICLQELVVETMPVSQLSPKGSKLVDLGSGAGQSKLVQANAGGTGTVDVSSFFSAGGVAFQTDGSLNITPQGAGTGDEIVTIVPKTNSTDATAYTSDQWPIAWTSDKLYQLQVTVKALGAGVTSPFDVMWLNMESPTNEANYETYVTSNGSLGSPNSTTTAATYTLLYNSQKKTASTTTSFANLRYRIRFGNTSGLRFPNGSATTNTGGVTVTGITLTELNAFN